MVDGVLTAALAIAVFGLDKPVVPALWWYLGACAVAVAVFVAANVAQNRGVLPGGFPIKPVRGAADAGKGSEFVFGGRDAAAEAAAKDKIVEDYIETVRSLVRAERFEECADLLHKALELDAGNSRLLNYMGICMGRMSRYDDAIRAYQSSIEVDYDNAGAHFNLAVALEHAERIPEAVQQYRRYLKIARVLAEPDDMVARAEDRLRFLKGSSEI